MHLNLIFFLKRWFFENCWSQSHYKLDMFNLMIQWLKISSKGQGWPLTFPRIVFNILKLVFSETIRPIQLKFHMKTPYDKFAKIYTNWCRHMYKMANIPIYGKNPLKSSYPELKDWWPFDLVCNIWDVGPTKFVQMMMLGWPWPT